MSKRLFYRKNELSYTIKNAVVELIDTGTVLCEDETNEYGGVLLIVSNLTKTNLLLHIRHIISVYKPIVVNISGDNHYDIILNEFCDLNNDSIIILDYNDLLVFRSGIICGENINAL